MSKRKRHAEKLGPRERSKAVNVRELCRLGVSPGDCVDAVIAAPNIESLIEAAKSGDKAAAIEVLALASAYLNTDTFRPMPLPLRRYLGNALAKASLGESAELALNLKRNGRTRQNRRVRLRIAHWIYKQMRAGNTLEEASLDCEEFLGVNIREHGKFYGYKKAPAWKTLQGIYNELLPEIKAIYEEVSRDTATLKS
jgi:hypothetical protein